MAKYYKALIANEQWTLVKVELTKNSFFQNFGIARKSEIHVTLHKFYRISKQLGTTEWTTSKVSQWNLLNIKIGLKQKAE